MSRKARFVFLDRAAFSAAELPAPACDHTWSEYPSTAAEDIVPRLFWATVAITHAYPLDAATLAQLHKLERIVVTGVAEVDASASAARGIEVLRVPTGDDAGVRLIALLDSGTRTGPLPRARGVPADQKCQLIPAERRSTSSLSNL